MPAISFTLGGKEISCELARKVTKDDLYGRLKKLTIKGDEVLGRGYLTADGRCVAASAISNGKLDPEGTPVDKEEVLYDGEPREALPFAQRAIELKNDDYAARTTLGAIYSALGDHEAAIVEFQQAAELGELSPKLLLNLAENYGKTKRFDEMVNTLDEVIRREPTAAAYERMGSGLFRLSRFEEALDAFQKATELDNTYFPAFNGVGVCLLQRWLASGQPDRLAREEGLRALRRSLQIKRDQPRVLELVGRHKN